MSRWFLALQRAQKVPLPNLNFGTNLARRVGATSTALELARCFHVHVYTCGHVSSQQQAARFAGFEEAMAARPLPPRDRLYSFIARTRRRTHGSWFAGAHVSMRPCCHGSITATPSFNIDPCLPSPRSPCVHGYPFTFPSPPKPTTGKHVSWAQWVPASPVTTGTRSAAKSSHSAISLEPASPGTLFPCFPVSSFPCHPRGVADSKIQDGSPEAGSQFYWLPCFHVLRCPCFLVSLATTVTCLAAKSIVSLLQQAPIDTCFPAALLPWSLASMFPIYLPT